LSSDSIPAEERENAQKIATVTGLLMDYMLRHIIITSLPEINEESQKIRKMLWKLNQSKLVKTLKFSQLSSSCLANFGRLSIDVEDTRMARHVTPSEGLEKASARLVEYLKKTENPAREKVREALKKSFDSFIEAGRPFTLAPRSSIITAAYHGVLKPVYSIFQLFNARFCSKKSHKYFAPDSWRDVDKRMRHVMDRLLTKKPITIPELASIGSTEEWYPTMLDETEKFFACVEESMKILMPSEAFDRLNALKSAKRVVASGAAMAIAEAEYYDEDDEEHEEGPIEGDEEEMMRLQKKRKMNKGNEEGTKKKAKIAGAPAQRPKLAALIEMVSELFHEIPSALKNPSSVRKISNASLVDGRLLGSLISKSKGRGVAHTFRGPVGHGGHCNCLLCSACGEIAAEKSNEAA
jgi:hypothetical protein